MVGNTKAIAKDVRSGDAINRYLFVAAYHAKCIDPWLTRNRRVCPICKRKVFAADESPHDGSDSDSDSDNDERTPLVRSEPSQQQSRRVSYQSIANAWFGFGSTNICLTLQPYILPSEGLFSNITRLPWPHRNLSSSSSSAGSIGESEVAVHHSMPARVVNSINSTDDDSMSGSVYSYQSAGQSSMNALQLPQNSYSDISHTVSLIESDVEPSDRSNDIARSVWTGKCPIVRRDRVLEHLKCS